MNSFTDSSLGGLNLTQCLDTLGNLVSTLGFKYQLDYMVHRGFQLSSCT